MAVKKTRNDYCNREEFLFSRQYLKLALDKDITDSEWGELSRAVIRYALTAERENVSKEFKFIYKEQCEWFDDKFSAWIKKCETNLQNGLRANQRKEESHPIAPSRTQSVSVGFDKPNGGTIDRLTDCQSDSQIDRLIDRRIDITASSPEGEPPEGFVDQTEWVKM